MNAVNLVVLLLILLAAFGAALLLDALRRRLKKQTRFEITPVKSEMHSQERSE